MGEMPPIVQLEYSTPAKAGRFGRGSVHPILTLLICTTDLATLLWILHEPLQGILTGRAFNGVFYSGSMQGPNPNSIWFFYVLTTVLVAFHFVYSAVARHLANRASAGGHLAFAIPMALASLCLAATVILPLYWTRLYLRTGTTNLRVAGIVYGAVLELALAAFTCWAIWPRKELARSSIGS